MKTSYLFLFLLLLASSGFAQRNFQDVVYLKNGAIVRGSIIELIPDKSIKIEEEDNNIFFFKMDDIDKITKEPSVKSQNRRGYLGLSIGPITGTGDFNKVFKVTSTVWAVNFGFLFTRNFGVTSSASYFNIPPNSVPQMMWQQVGYRSLSNNSVLVGPLITFPIFKKIEWDFRPMLGASVTSFTESESFISSSQMAPIAYSFGTQVRWNMSRGVSFMIKADYFATSHKLIGNGWRVSNLGEVLNVNIRTVSIGLMAAYRLR